MMTTAPVYRYIRTSLILIILLVSGLYLLRPVMDYDFFWHLRTGQWIWENQQLLNRDIFSYTTPALTTLWEQIILTSYWLSQVLYHLCWSSGGAFGIIILRICLVAGLIYFMAGRAHGDDILFLGLLMLFLISVLEVFPVERPQVFSFLFFSMLLYLLDKITDPGDQRQPLPLILLPLVMLAWANTHGGFLVGQMTIALYIAAEAVKQASPSLNPGPRKDLYRLAAAGGAGIAASLINPNSYHLLIEIMTAPAPHRATVIEYQPSIVLFQRFGDHTQIVNWIVMALALSALLLQRRRPDITQTLLLGGTGYFAFTQVRYMPFFLIAAIPVISRAFSAQNLLVPVRALVLIAALTAAAFFAVDERGNISSATSGQWIHSANFPVSAADFIQANRLTGNMYNYYAWGGYLIWRLFPEQKVFIDGRALSEHVYRLNLAIDAAASRVTGGLPFWKAALNHYSVNFIVTRTSHLDGKAMPLVTALLNDRDWVPVFLEAEAVIFVRDIPANYPVTSRYSIPKESVRSGVAQYSVR